MMKKIKTPITYYGGKQKLVNTILPLIPEHNLYCEPFIGGGAIFWAKPKSNVEVINDTNQELINFYEVVQKNYVELEKEIRITLHSRRLFADAKVVYNNPHMFSRIKRAWALWTLSAEGFAGMLDSSWGYDKKAPTTSRKIRNKRNGFSEDLAQRLQDVQIECTDALRIVKTRDTKDSFFYCDPPYFNSDCGHYDGYSKDDFETLLITLSQLEGKFLLSSYPSPILKEYTKRFGWHKVVKEQTVSVNALGDKPRKRKSEVLTTNYPIDVS